MARQKTNLGTEVRSNICDIGLRVGSTKPIITAARCTLALVVLSALLLVGARPAQAQTETVLYTFTGGTDGWAPAQVLDIAGNLYGTTLLGGQGCWGNQSGCGVVYELSPNGSGGWNQTVLHSFPSSPDAANPFSGVMSDKSGNLYGTTGYGGTANDGAVYKLTAAGTSWTETVLYSFAYGSGGYSPRGTLILDTAGNLYGTNLWGGAYGKGTVFKLEPSGTETLLYTFGSQSGDGSAPWATLVFDDQGNLYGTTSAGGANNQGTVFKLTPGGVETVLYSFGSRSGDGSVPSRGVVFDANGNLYGTTSAGGANNQGTVFELTPGGVETVLYSFGSQPGDGSDPIAPVVFDASGNLYGTTYQGGAKNLGTVFELTPSGVETVLYSFGSQPADGSGPGPCCALVFGSNGNLYGTTGAGAYGVGTVFELSLAPALPTTTSLTSTRNPSTYGQNVPFTTTVTSSSGTPTGTVQILYGSTVVGSGTLVSGSVSIPVSTLPAGSDSITAAYLGGSGFAPSKSSPLTQTVTQAATSTTLASSLNPAGTGQSVTFTATVGGQYGGATTGTVTFMAGSQSLGSAPLSGNVAALATSFATAGTYSVTALYSGDSNNVGSTSGMVSEKIIASTTTMLTSSLNPSMFGQGVTFTAFVTSLGGTPPNGEVITFYNGTAVLGTAPLSGGTAAISTSSLPAGIFTITASYPGDSNFAASTSSGLRQVVNATTKSATSTTLTSSLNPSIYGQSVTFTATVTTTGSLPPTGTVAFTWQYFTETYTLGVATLNSSGVATLTKSNLNADLYPVTAVYKGDTNNLGSTSPVVNQSVLQTTSTAAITASPSPSTVGESVTFTATISSPTVRPTGPVTFTAGQTVLGSAQLSRGTATLATSALPEGSNVVKVTYNGDSDIAKSSASVTQTVQP